MTKYILALAALLYTITLPAQQCDCASQFSFVRDYYETNNPAFQKIKADPAAYRQYNQSVKQLSEKINRELSPDRCNTWFDQYIALLKDHHSSASISISRLNIDFKSKAAIDSFRQSPSFRSFKVIPVDTTALLARLSALPASGLEGIYTNGGSITFALVKEGTNHYNGIVLRKNSLLDPGHLLLELEATPDPAVFNSIYHTGLLAFNFQSVYKTVEIRNGKIPEFGFYKLGTTAPQSEPVYTFRALDDQTNYLQLSSFDYDLKEELNTFYTSIDSAIASKPYLVIDLRDNGGGSEECYFNLMPYVYTQPFRVDDVDVWVTPENIRQYENNGGQDTALIRRMKEAPTGTFIPQVENAIHEWTMDSSAYPKKIAVLYNRKTASAAEGMITYCRQSRKVITLGENSGGYIGYGNVMETITPCGNYQLRNTTTRYRTNSRYEFTGIPPMIRLAPEDDWIQAAVKALK